MIHVPRPLSRGAVVFYRSVTGLGIAILYALAVWQGIGGSPSWAIFSVCVACFLAYCAATSP